MFVQVTFGIESNHKNGARFTSFFLTHVKITAEMTPCFQICMYLAYQFFL
eukprot:NODE_10875_length_322_cov_9.937729_g9962_i0.p1 GENE.NODE_10875_length_322_cov_9.937729_g9962_i0~~NODE_10875_length_322_cov_9.937729_g9962_i0.p1  ORF type:complete len:50 (+),score=4.90 NODE_10875_length_322_cov_9.937729_g9962_i0:100-249(+)